MTALVVVLVVLAVAAVPTVRSWVRFRRAVEARRRRMYGKVPIQLE